MTQDELFKKIWNLPVFPYRYSNEYENRDYYVLLGYYESNQLATHKLSMGYTDIVDSMIDLYDEVLTEDGKARLARSMHKLQRMCNYHFENMRNKDEQKAFISGLNKENFDSVARQVEMYISARDWYSKGYR